MMHPPVTLRESWHSSIVVQEHPTAAIEAADTPASAISVSRHGRDVAGLSEAMQHAVAEKPREQGRSLSASVQLMQRVMRL